MGKKHIILEMRCELIIEFDLDYKRISLVQVVMLDLKSSMKHY